MVGVSTAAVGWLSLGGSGKCKHDAVVNTYQLLFMLRCHGSVTVRSRMQSGFVSISSIIEMPERYAACNSTCDHSLLLPSYECTVMDVLVLKRCVGIYKYD